jgi:hypothetical protein
MNKTLNDALNDAKYPEFTNRLFDCLVLPFGGVQTKNFKSYKPVKGYIDNSSKDTNYECLEEDVYDTLFGLAKYKISKTLTKKKPILKDNNKTQTKTQKNAKKREKIINQIHSSSSH